MVRFLALALCAFVSSVVLAAIAHAQDDLYRAPPKEKVEPADNNPFAPRPAEQKRPAQTGHAEQPKAKKHSVQTDENIREIL
ncbi:MAG TPA: hypothetical protein VFW87_05720, partial [Pirellulales bacterium]|nr:hypothetical protein [Pirellulales bacterium]